MRLKLSEGNEVGNEVLILTSPHDVFAALLTIVASSLNHCLSMK